MGRNFELFLSHLSGVVPSSFILSANLEVQQSNLLRVPLSATDRVEFQGYRPLHGIIEPLMHGHGGVSQLHILCELGGLYRNIYT